MRKSCLMIFSVALLAAPHAMAAKFSAKADEGVVIVYSTSTKAEHCRVMANFTYLENGKREEGWTSCGDVITKPGKDIEVCRFEDPRVVAPLITSIIAEGEGCKQ